MGNSEMAANMFLAALNDKGPAALPIDWATKAAPQINATSKSMSEYLNDSLFMVNILPVLCSGGTNVKADDNGLSHSICHHHRYHW